MAQKPASAVMPARRSYWPRKTKFTLIYTALFICLVLASLLLTFLPKPDQKTLSHFHLTHASYYGLIIPITIFLVLIWLTALYGSVAIKSYANLIKKDREGRAFYVISVGLLVLAIAQPINSTLSGLAGQIGRHSPDLIPTTVIINNYVSIFLMALSFVLIAIGAQRLCGVVKDESQLLPQRAWVLSFIIFSALYSYFIVIQPIHTPLARRSYFLPDWLLVVTIAIPYLCIWYLGLNAAYQITQFQKNVRGWLYKKALIYLAGGIVVVIISSVVSRVITTVSSSLNRLSLTPLLFIVLGILAIDAAGFILIAYGAKQLRKIEEV